MINRILDSVRIGVREAELDIQHYENDLRAHGKTYATDQLKERSLDAERWFDFDSLNSYRDTINRATKRNTP